MEEAGKFNIIVIDNKDVYFPIIHCVIMEGGTLKKKI